MKSYFFLGAVCFLLGANSSVQAIISFKFPKNVARQLFGPGSLQRELNCKVLLDQSFSVPNAQVTPFCNDAQTSCIRYGLIEQKLKTLKGNVLETLKKHLALAQDETELKLLGCYLALESSLTNGNLLGRPGSYAPTLPLHRPSRR